MKKSIFSVFVITLVAFVTFSCGNQELKVNKKGVESDLIKVESPILDEYGELMPNCKNIVAVDVEGIDVADAIVYLDEDGGDAYMEAAGVGLVPYKGSTPVVMIVSFDEEGGTKEFKVAEELPAPKVRFFNAETFEIQDFSIENISAVVVEVVADAKFAELFPNDAEYQIVGFDAALIRGGEELQKIESPEEQDDFGNQIDISTLQENAEAGDVIVVNITELQRINFEGAAYPVEVPENMIGIELTVK